MQDTGSDSAPPSSPTLPQDLSSKHMSSFEKSTSSCSEEAETSSSEEGYKCPGCEIVTITRGELTAHLRSAHGSAATGGCSLCGKVLGSQASLDRHLLVHSGERPFKCQDCGLAFTTNGNMNRHLRSHRHPKRKLECNNNVDEPRKKPKPEPYDCPRCERDFVSLHVLESHLEEAHPEWAARCLSCGLVFKSYRVLNLHRFMVHYQPDTPRPDLSFVEFSTEKFPLIAEAMTRPLPSPPPTDSQKDFFETLDLKKSPVKKEAPEIITDIITNGMIKEEPSEDVKDIDIINSVDITPPDSNYKEVEEEQDCFASELRKMKAKGEFPCRLCQAVFPNLRALKGHNRVHLAGGGRTFQCNMCPYFDSDKAAVIRHMRTHNGDRPYECSLCNYAFTTKANCERHLRNRHAASRDVTKRSILYHPEPEQNLEKDCKVDVKRSLFPADDPSFARDSDSQSDEDDSDREEVPLDLSMDALDLRKKKPEEEPEDLSKKNREITVPKVDVFYPSPHLMAGFTPPFSPYYVPPMYYQERELAEMKERIQKELIRSIRLSSGGVVVQEPPPPSSPEPPPPPPKKVEPAVKMVIKNGVLVPKQKQRRYRTERPFGCEHCSARFTLRSNMERHVKQQHPQLWSQRQRGGGGGGRRSRTETSDPEVRAALAEAIKAKEPKPKDSDLASVSKLLDNASTQTFKQFFSSEDDPPHSDEEGLVASHSEENSGSDEAKSEEGGLTKKKSAYSLAPNRVSCPYCSREFPWSSSLRRHVLTHTGQKPFKCTHCPLLFTTKSNCDRHLLRKHSSGTRPLSSNHEKPFRCEKCPGSRFPSSEALRRHTASRHDGDSHETSACSEQPFKCHLCEGSFRERQEALDHLQISHPLDYASLLAKGALDSSSGDEEADDPQPTDNTKFPDYTNRKVMCALCVRRFWSAEDLRRHMRTHTGERPFSCDVCQRRFTLKHSMLRHRKKHDPSSPPPTLLSANHHRDHISHHQNAAAQTNNNGEETDLICSLLGLRDTSLVDKMIERKDQAALLLGIHSQSQTTSPP